MSFKPEGIDLSFNAMSHVESRPAFDRGIDAHGRTVLSLKVHIEDATVDINVRVTPSSGVDLLDECLGKALIDFLRQYSYQAQRKEFEAALMAHPPRPVNFRNGFEVSYVNEPALRDVRFVGHSRSDDWWDNTNMRDI